MKFGRLETGALTNIAWELPKDTAITEALLAGLPPRNQSPAIYIGCSVWTDPSFVGKVYPKGTPAKDFLKICEHLHEISTSRRKIVIVEQEVESTRPSSLHKLIASTL